MKNTMTNKKALEFVLGLDQVKGNVEVLEKLQKMLEQVEKKNASSTDKPNKNQLVNEQLKEVILSEMVEIGKPVQIKDLISLTVFTGISSQKMSALVRQLVATGEVVRTEEKKIAYFEVVKVEVIEE